MIKRGPHSDMLLAKSASTLLINHLTKKTPVIQVFNFGGAATSFENDVVSRIFEVENSLWKHLQKLNAFWRSLECAWT